jgi:hypothetical protein
MIPALKIPLSVYMIRLLSPNAEIPTRRDEKFPYKPFNLPSWDEKSEI